MTILFETLKIIFFLITFFFILFVQQGATLFGDDKTQALSTTLMPGYLVLVGLVIAYIMGRILQKPDASYEQTRTLYTRMFILGIVIGVFLALIYIAVL